MPRKPKFKPKITRVKLNPEQAVLACACYANDKKVVWSGGGPWQVDPTASLIDSCAPGIKGNFFKYSVGVSGNDLITGSVSSS